jgi:hypothetical protein
VGIPWFGTGSPGTATGDIAGMGRWSTRRGACRACAGVGRKPTRRSASGPCARGGASATPRAATCSGCGAGSDLGCPAGGAGACRITLLGRAATGGCATSACRAATRRRTPCAIMGIARRGAGRPGRRSCTGMESARSPLVGRCPAGRFGAGPPGDGLGRAVGSGGARDPAGAFLE